MNKENKDNEETSPSGITRKDAIKKMGKYAALTALGTVSYTHLTLPTKA